MPVAGEEELARFEFLLVRTSITERWRQQKHTSFTEAEPLTILQTPFSNNASLAKHKIAQPRTAKKNTRKDTHKTHYTESKTMSSILFPQDQLPTTLDKTTDKRSNESSKVGENAKCRRTEC
jgi:hypothetical protein